VAQGDRYPPGTPCWVETRQRDPQRACAFYGALFGWRFSPQGDGLVAHAGGGDVAGVAPLGPLAGAAWITHVRVRGVAATVAAVQSAGGSLAAPPASAVPAGWAALVRDPAGALLGVWETGGHPGALPVNEPDLWDLSELHTTDPAGAVAFYEQLFGWRAEPLGATTLWRLPGYHGGIEGQPVPRDAIATMAPPGPEPVDVRWSVDFRVADVDATAGEAVRLGATLVEPPHDTPGFRTAVLADPEGARFSITAFA
jgi:predicted enzyme related to lactoylglutathione lyase